MRNKKQQNKTMQNRINIFAIYTLNCFLNCMTLRMTAIQRNWVANEELTQ